MFNKNSDWTYDTWRDSEACKLLKNIPTVKWVGKPYMTDEEKKLYPEYEITGGYYKILDKECRQAWWDKLPEKHKKVITSLPNFNSSIFKECTGIDVKE